MPTPYLAPATELERKIAAVWQKALGFERVGVADNFFELGGDSFNAMYVIAQLKKELAVEVPVAGLYEGLTVRSLGQLLAQTEAVAEAPPEARAERRGFHSPRTLASAPGAKRSGVPDHLPPSREASEGGESRAERRRQYQQTQRSRRRSGDENSPPVEQE